MIHVLAFVIAFLGSKVVFNAVGFRYDVFTEPFSLTKFAFDFGVWALWFAAAQFVLRRSIGRA